MKKTANLFNSKRAIITVEIQCHNPEKIINLLWKKGLYLKNIHRESITSIIIDMHLKDYTYLEEAIKRTNGKIKIIGRKGSTFVILKVQKRIALLLGLLLFICIVYYLSTFIWRIDINTDAYISPYETRSRLYSYGIKPGIKKMDLDTSTLEQNFIRDYDDVMWIKVRMQGSSLKVTVEGRQSPPKIISDVTPCNLVALRDGEVVRVYTTAGTSVVKQGDIVKKGQMLVKGIQGKEGMEYQVHSNGDVIAHTFYQDSKTALLKGSQLKRTGKTITRYYIEINGNKYYIKNSVNNFKTYDKIVYDNILLKKEVFYETKQSKFSLDIEKEKKKIEKQLYNKIILNIDKKVKIINKISSEEEKGDTLTVNYTVVGEENIAIPETIP